MLVPAKRSFFDDFMMSPFESFFDIPMMATKPGSDMMKTDIKETDKDFELTIDMPGVNKDDVTVDISNGYLDVEADSKKETEDKGEDGSYLRKERFEGKCSRKFYVGDEVDDDHITAKFDNGVLNITVPKVSQPEVEGKKTIAIEG